MDPEKFKIWSK